MSKILVLTHEQVTQLLPMKECITLMAEALTALSTGQVYQPLRMVMQPPDTAGLMVLMPAYRSGQDRSGQAPAFGLKTLCIFPPNPARIIDTHQGSVMLLSGETGELLALMNAAAITAIRTAAASGLATQLLARPEAGDLAIVGSGVQARSHLEAMACVRSIKRARVASRNAEHAREFVRQMQPRYSFPIQAVDGVEEAVRGADLIVTATNARTPVLRREWIAPGAHLNVVGASQPTAREVDTATLAAASLFVDRRESTLHEAGDYILAVQEGAIGPDHIRAEIAEVLAGSRPGRTTADEITLFKSLGVAVEDLVSAQYAYQQAQAQGVGTWVEF